MSSGERERIGPYQVGVPVSFDCGLDDGKTSKLLPLSSTVAVARPDDLYKVSNRFGVGRKRRPPRSGVGRAVNCNHKRLEDLAKEGDSPVDSFPWFDPSQ